MVKVSFVTELRNWFVHTRCSWHSTHWFLLHLKHPGSSEVGLMGGGKEDGMRMFLRERQFLSPTIGAEGTADFILLLLCRVGRFSLSHFLIGGLWGWWVMIMGVLLVGVLFW